MFYSKRIAELESMLEEALDTCEAYSNFVKQLQKRNQIAQEVIEKGNELIQLQQEKIQLLKEHNHLLEEMLKLKGT